MSLLYFNGNDTYIDVPLPSPSNNGGAITVEFWNYVKTEDAQMSYAFAFQRSDTGQSNNRTSCHAPWVLPDNHSAFPGKNIFWDYGTWTQSGRVFFNYAGYLGQWTHVALVCTGTIPLERLQAIYLNGEEVKRNDKVDKMIAPDHVSTRLLIGGDYEGGTKYLYHHKGWMDNFRVWNIARTQADIKRDMYRQMKGTESGLLTCFNFNVTGDLSKSPKNELTNIVSSGPTGTLYNFSSTGLQPPSLAPIKKEEKKADSTSIRISNNPAYNFGTKGFTVMAVITPRTIQETAPGKTQVVIATGNIVSKYDPKQKKASGWELTLIVNPPNKPVGYYLSFSLYGTDGKKFEYLAPLKNEYKSNYNVSWSDDIFKEYTHIVAAVRDENSIKLYLNGKSLNNMNQPGSTTQVDVTNSEPLKVGKLSPASPDGEWGGIISKLSLWKKALSETDVVSCMNHMFDSEINKWNDPGCVGYWEFDGSMKDLSATKNDVPIDQIVPIQKRATIWPFYMEDQKTWAWCWAATGVSIEKFYGPQSSLTQCEFATRVAKDQSVQWIIKALGVNQGYLTVSGKIKYSLADTESCCDDQVKCLFGFHDDATLRMLGKYRSKMPVPEKTEDFEKYLETCRSEIDKRRPVMLYLEWTLSKGHFAILSGYIQNSDGKVVSVVINDSQAGISIVTPEKLKTGYVSAGYTYKWIHSCFTKPS